VSTTYDGGKTWQTTDATPNDPVQRGSICTGGTTCGNDRNLLDFIDSTIDSHGRVEVGYADGCIGACVTDSSHTSGAGPADAQAAYATIARQSSGLPLFSAYDPAQPNATVQSMSLSNSAGQYTASIKLANTGTAPLSNLTTAVTDNGKVVGQVTGTNLAAGASKVVTVSWKQVKGQQIVVATADPANSIAESNEADNKASATIKR
jgi:hypothetical protein